MKIKNLKQHEDGTWSFRLDDTGCYYTNANGEGLFYQSYRFGDTHQIIGSCQFSVCKTASGTRRKLNRLFENWPM